ncbi:MAG: hypothetical protein ACYS22_19965 [Planctomycetota bacterium]
MTTKSREDFVQRAERFYRAAGYRRQGTGNQLLFVRGKPFASLWAPSTQDCAMRVTIEHRAKGREGGVVTVKQKHAEARCFQDFLESEVRNLDLTPLEDARRFAFVRSTVLGVSVLALSLAFGVYVFLRIVFP